MQHAMIKETLQIHEKRTGSAPDAAAFAPGRIEVLGNHTDYNSGRVLSAATPMGIVFALTLGEGPEGVLYAANIEREARFTVAEPRPLEGETWANYVIGVWDGLTADRRLQTGWTATVYGDLPSGAGLSSSAALEMSAALAFAKAFDLYTDPLELARIGQTAETEYTGVRCGLLDQLSSLHGQAGRIIDIDFQSLEVDTLPLSGDAGFLVCHTGVSHQLSDSAYNERREACERAAAVCNASSLREVSVEDLERHADKLDDEAARRARHVVREIDRVENAAEMLRAGDLDAFGRLMTASHRSSQHDFENSCDELDFIVDFAERRPDALGARLSGGGWGGSAIVLVRENRREVVERDLIAAYNTQWPRPLTCDWVAPADGACCCPGSCARRAAR